MLIHLASVTHNYGATIFAGASEAQLMKKVATWCNNFRTDSPNPQEVKEAFERGAHQDTVMAYFTNHFSEGIVFDTDEVDDL